MAEATPKKSKDTVVVDAQQLPGGLTPEELQLVLERVNMQEVREELLQRQLAEHRGGTLRELMEAAQEGGWVERLLDMKVKDAFGAGPKSTRRNTSSTRRSPEQIDADHLSILGFLRKNPGSGVAAIVPGAGVSKSTASNDLQSLVLQKRVVMEGTKRRATYTVRD